MASHTSDPIDHCPPLADLPQVSYRESFARRMSGGTAPLLPVDADMAVHARELDDAAHAQANARQRPIDDSVER